MNLRMDTLNASLAHELVGINSKVNAIFDIVARQGIQQRIISQYAPISKKFDV